MPLRPRPAMDALLDAYLAVLSLLELRLGAQTQERLELLRDRLALVATRDDGRGAPSPAAQGLSQPAASFSRRP